ncbi:hypothetical protein LG322_08715 [Microbacterium aerolatum]|uniref:hypothetical protein n=1 Tax=Microbacterium aerolatum TaxID=153731 RepID=UPI00384E9CE5
MPIKRTPRAQRETPAARALRAAVADELDAMMRRIPDDPAETEAQRRKGEKRARKFAARVMRDGLDAAMEWEASKRPSEPARTRIDAYAAHRQTVTAQDAAASATRVAPAAEEATTAEDAAEPQAPRRRRRAGVVRYIDPRLIDADDWED